jgi:hypothetical protein
VFKNNIFNDNDNAYLEDDTTPTPPAAAAAAVVVVDVDPLINDTLSDIQIVNTVEIDPLVNDTLSDIQILNTVEIDPLVNGTLSQIQIDNVVEVTPLINETLSQIQVDNMVSISPLLNETLSQIQINNVVRVDPLVNETLSEIKVDNVVTVDPLINETLSQIQVENVVEITPLVNETLSKINIENIVGVTPLINDTLSQLQIGNTVMVDPLVNNILSDVKIENVVVVTPLVNDTVSDVNIENAVDVDPLVNDSLSDVKIENAVDVDPLVNDILSDVKIENAVAVTPLVNDTLSDVKIDSVVGIEPLVNDITSEIKPSVLETTSPITQKTAINPNIDSGLFYNGKLIKKINSDYFYVLKNDDTQKYSILIKRIDRKGNICREIDDVITDLENKYNQFVLIVNFDEEIQYNIGQFRSHDYNFELNILIILKFYLDKNEKFETRKQEIIKSYSISNNNIFTISKNKFDFSIIQKKNDNLFKEKSYIVNNLLLGSLLDNRTVKFLNEVDKLYNSLFEILYDEFLQNQLLNSSHDINIVAVSNQSHVSKVKEKFPIVVIEELRDAKLPCLQFTNRFDLDKLIQEIQKRDTEQKAEADRLERLKREAAADAKLKREAAAETERLKREAAAAETARLKREAAIVEADRLKKKAEAKEARLQSEESMKQDMLNNDGDFKDAMVEAQGFSMLGGAVPGTFTIPIDLSKYVSDTTHWNTADNDQIVWFMRWKLEPFTLTEVDIIFKVFIGNTQIMRYKINDDEKIKASQNNTNLLTDYNTVEITYDMIKDRTDKNLKIIFMNDGVQFRKKIYYKYTEPSWRGKEKTKIDNSLITREITNSNLDQFEF